MASSKAALELPSTVSFTATNNSWASRGMVCLNKGQILLPCYWPFYRSERHQLGKAATMPPVTFIPIVMWTTLHRSWSRTCKAATKGKLLTDVTGFVSSMLAPFQEEWEIFLKCFTSLTPLPYTKKIICWVCGVLSLLLSSWDRQGQPPQVWARYHRPCWPYGHLNMHTGRAS